MTRRDLVLTALTGLLAAAAEPVAEPAGYRMDEYQAPTPATLRGATVLSTAQAHSLWTEDHAAFIDVLPQAPRPPNLPASTIWRSRPRDDIPGSLWLPDTGYGALAPVMQAYFKAGLTKASAGNRSRLLVFYCQANCWMSWNAAKRAMHLGFPNVAWYSEGTDGWRASGFPLETRQAEPRPDVWG